MGEAKRRRAAEALVLPLTQPMKRARFNIYTIGSRLSMAGYTAIELSWWSSEDETVLGLTAMDTTDEDYLWIIMLRDRLGRFRCVDLETDINSPAAAEMKLRVKMAQIITSGDVVALGYQDDETNHAIDLFDVPASTKPEDLHPYFRMLKDDDGRAPARKVFQELAKWLAPKDPHLVREFQGAGFDQRLWELYLWAVLKEFSLDIEQLEAPDFRCTGPGIDFSIEATTVTPSMSGVLADHPKPKTPEEMKAFLAHYMPMKFGGALTSKLNKTNAEGLHYWERDETKGKPFLIALADFHAPADADGLGSMTYTQSALWQYLYGNRLSYEFVDGKLKFLYEKIGEHKYKEKVVPSGFFDLLGAENVSAILFSNAGTLAKFDRMGVVGGFGAERHMYFRHGLRFNPDPNAVVGIPFSEDVSSEDYSEWWTQEIQVFHNPNAKYPLKPEALEGATHHFYENGEISSITPHDAVLASFTSFIKLVPSEEWDEAN